MDKRSILIFGLGFLQKSLIEQCKELGLFTVGIDVSADAVCRDDVDVFEVVAGDDFDATLAVAEQYNISGVVTAATDKPLVMMARIAEALNLPFYSVQTARWSTDKLLMKQRFQQYGIPCARGMEVESAGDIEKIDWAYPVIVKPRDNSGSRGVIFCANKDDATRALAEAFEYTRKETALVEEFIEGREYSIESLHYNGETHVVQFTQKITTEFPYNVELGHIQPADLTDEQKASIIAIIHRIAEALGFVNCASHTELKTNKDGITVIETSPRLGGDFITSMLTPLSTGVNLEKLLVRMSVNDVLSAKDFEPIIRKSSGVVFFELPEGQISYIGDINKIRTIAGCQLFAFDKKVGDTVKTITSSVDRYGYVLFQTNSRECTELSIGEAKELLENIVRINP